MSITDWPADERPREKLLKQGATALSDAELLAIFLRTGCRGRTAVDLARDLLGRFGGLGPLLAADKRQFCQSKGLGEAKYSQLQAVLEISRRYLWEQVSSGQALDSAEATRQFLSLQLKAELREVFCCLFLCSTRVFEPP